jgi:hypothetical protein
MSKKYVIDIPDDAQYILINGASENHCYTRVEQVDDLEELNSDYISEHYGELQDEAYQAGLKDGWETARALVWDTSISEYETAGVNVESWDGETCEVLRRYPAHEAVELLRTISEHKDSDRIEVGDEVVTRGLIPDNTFLVTKVIESSVYGISNDGSWNFYNKDSVTKTGKHYDIASILEAMRK